jgi:N6-L-threonylcarbamoyladenine synthase
MIAYAGALRLAAGQYDSASVDVRPRWDMAGLAPLESEHGDAARTR